MRRDEALAKLREAKPLWEKIGVSRLSIFGSVARDEARAGSDVDLLVEFSGDAGLFELFRLRNQLEAVLGTRVDLGTRDSLRPELRSVVLSEAVDVA